MVFALIMSGLALLAACACLSMTVKNEKRSRERSNALVRYVDKSIEGVEKKRQETEEIVKRYTDAAISPVREKISALESGILPDYEQAKAAAEAVNDFSRGISNILGFDPMKAQAEQRKKEESGGAE